RKRVVSVEAVESRLLFAVLPVLNTNDDGAGSLRDAIASAQNGDTVDLTGVSGTINLATELAIGSNLTLPGPGAGTLAISGGGSESETTGGGITLTRCTIANNAANQASDENFPFGGEARGGGIALFGTGNNSLVNCTIAGNNASATSGQEFFFFGEAIGGGI